jgi:hypothetical protein
MTQLAANSISVNVFVCNQNVPPEQNGEGSFQSPATGSALLRSTGTLYALSR